MINKTTALRIYIALIFGGLIALPNCSLQAQDLWRVGTAYTLPKGWFDKGVFQPLRYGLSAKTELYTWPLANMFVPNMGIKHRWYITENRILISSRHGLYYPVMFYKRLQGSGANHLFPPNQPIKFGLPNYHELLASKFLRPATSCDLPDLLLTIRLGFQMSIGHSPELSTIDYPGVYQRTVPFMGPWLWYTGADLEGHLTEMLNYSVDVDFYSVGALKQWAVEHKGLLVYPINNRWTLAGGYKLHLGTTPYQFGWKLVPLVDISYKFRLRRRSKMEFGLFDNDLFKYDYPMEKTDPLEDHLLEEYYDQDPKVKKKKKEEEPPQPLPVPPNNP